MCSCCPWCGAVRLLLWSSFRFCSLGSVHNDPRSNTQHWDLSRARSKSPHASSSPTSSLCCGRSPLQGHYMVRDTVALTAISRHVASRRYRRLDMSNLTDVSEQQATGRVPKHHRQSHILSACKLWIDRPHGGVRQIPFQLL